MMSFLRQQWPRVVTAAAILTVLLLALHWRPSRQVRLHQEHLLRAVEDRRWKTVGEFMAADYKDRWGQTKPMVLAQLPQVFGDFLALGVLGENTKLTWTNGGPTASSNIRIVGSGGPIAQIVMQHSKTLTEPFLFRWRHESWKPWDWALIEVDQPQLKLSEGFSLDF